MSERNLPDWIDGFMLLTDNSEPPLLFRKWTAISTVAAALMRKVKVELGISLVFYPNFYIVLVGPSATGKGTAMKYASDIIEQVPNIALSAQATSLQALIRRQMQTNHTDICMQTGDQIFHSSMTVFSNEFTVFLGYHNRELITSLCDWYDCPNRWTYDTIRREKEIVIGCWMNILAGTTPDQIKESLPTAAIGAGLTSRIIFVVEDAREKLVVFEDSSDRRMQLQEYLIHDLERIYSLAGTFRFTEEAVKYYEKWVHYAADNPPFHNPKFDGYCGRRRNHLLSLAMVCSASRGDSLSLTADDIERAAYLLAEVENKMGTVFRGIGRSDIASLIADASAFIERSKYPRIPIWRFYRYFEGDMDKLTMERVLQTLEASNYIKIVRYPDKDNEILILGRKQRAISQNVVGLPPPESQE